MIADSWIPCSTPADRNKILRMTRFWLQRSQMLIGLHDQPVLGAPAERNVLVVKYVEIHFAPLERRTYRARSL